MEKKKKETPRWTQDLVAKSDRVAKRKETRVAEAVARIKDNNK